MKIILIILSTLLISQGVYADIIFDTFTPPNTNGGFSSADGGVGTFISVENNTEITGISILNNILTQGELKFVIFDAVGHDLLYSSEAKMFSADSEATWKQSSDFSFVLLGGNDYQIGYMRSVGVIDYADRIQESYNGFSSRLSLACLTDFDNPRFTHNCISGVDNAVRLHAAVVPEPSTLLLLGSGLVGLAGLRKRFKT